MKIAYHLFVLVVLFMHACATSPEYSGPVGESVDSDQAVFSAEGRASMVNGNIFQARRKAVESAIRAAAKQSGTKISNSMLIGNTKIVDEWQEQDMYHVQVLAVLSSSRFCQSPYRKRIVATAFPIVSPGQLSGNESQDLYGGIPREINNLLMESGEFIGRNKTETVLYSEPERAPDIQQADDYFGSSVINLASEAQSQFVLSGVIRDFSVESSEYVRGAGALAQVKAAFRDVVARRGITMDIYVHDGFTGSLLFQHRYSDSIIGDVWIPGGYAVGSERFSNTPAGHKISQIMRMASVDIRRIIGCYPFAARVVKIDQDRIVIAAGAQDRIKPDDRMVVYSASSATHGLGVTGTHKEAIGLLSIDQVEGAFASGRLERPGDLRKIRVGDWVKSW